MSNRDVILWDSEVFCSFLDKTRADHDEAAYLVGMAEASNPLFTVTTSTLAIAEVGGIYRNFAKPKQFLVDVDELNDLWKRSVANLIPCNRPIMEAAREIVRGSVGHQNRATIRGADAVFLATASKRQAKFVVTSDSTMLSWSGDPVIQGVRVLGIKAAYHHYHPIFASSGST